MARGPTGAENGPVGRNVDIQPLRRGIEVAPGRQTTVPSIPTWLETSSKAAHPQINQILPASWRTGYRGQICSRAIQLRVEFDMWHGRHRVLAGACPLSMPLIAHAKDVDADLRRYVDVARAETQTQPGLVFQTQPGRASLSPRQRLSRLTTPGSHPTLSPEVDHAAACRCPKLQAATEAQSRKLTNAFAILPTECRKTLHFWHPSGKPSA